MAQRRRQSPSLVGDNTQPLIAVPIEEDGKDRVLYFTSEDAADAALPYSVTEDALSVIGAWADLDWDEMERALYEIRHANPPTPPITEL